LKKALKWGLLAAFAILALLLAYRLNFFSVDFITGFSEISLGLTILVIIALYALKGVIMVFPTPILYVAAGLAFPSWLGVIVTYAGLTVSLSIGHAIGQRMGEEKVNKLLAKNKMVASLLNKDNENLLWLAFISRILPTPFGLVSLFFGALNVPYSKCMFMSLLGLSPFMIPTVLAGSAITNPFSAEFIVPFSISIVVTGIILLVYKSKLVTNNHSKEEC